MRPLRSTGPASKATKSLHVATNELDEEKLPAEKLLRGRKGQEWAGLSLSERRRFMASSFYLQSEKRIVSLLILFYSAALPGVSVGECSESEGHNSINLALSAKRTKEPSSVCTRSLILSPTSIGST